MVVLDFFEFWVLVEFFFEFLKLEPKEKEKREK